jgi:hypothetical protein
MNNACPFHPQGAVLPDVKPTTPCTAYIDYLRRLVQDARRQFLSGDTECLEATRCDNSSVFRTGQKTTGFGTGRRACTTASEHARYRRIAPAVCGDRTDGM